MTYPVHSKGVSFDATWQAIFAGMYLANQFVVLQFLCFFLHLSYFLRIYKYAEAPLWVFALCLPSKRCHSAIGLQWN